MILLDEFRRDGDVFVGNTSGQTFDESGATLDYSYALPEGATDVDLIFKSAFSSCYVSMKIDNVRLDGVSEEVVSSC